MEQILFKAKEIISNAVFAYFDYQGFDENADFSVKDIKGLSPTAIRILTQKPRLFNDRSLEIFVYTDGRIKAKKKGLNGQISRLNRAYMISVTGEEVNCVKKGGIKKDGIDLFFEEGRDIRGFHTGFDDIFSTSSTEEGEAETVGETFTYFPIIDKNGELKKLRFMADVFMRSSSIPRLWITDGEAKICENLSNVMNDNGDYIGYMVFDKGRCFIRDIMEQDYIHPYMTLGEEKVFREAYENGTFISDLADPFMGSLIDLWGKDTTPPPKDKWGSRGLRPSETHKRTVEIFMRGANVTNGDEMREYLKEIIDECQSVMDQYAAVIKISAEFYGKTHYLKARTAKTLKFEFCDETARIFAAVLSRWERHEKEPLVDEDGRFSLNIPEGIPTETVDDLEAIAKTYILYLTRSEHPHDIRAVLY